jgi:hypothetical protein
MNCFRLIRGFVDSASLPGGATAYIGDLQRWDHIFKDTLYATQEILGDAVAVCSCSLECLYYACLKAAIDLSMLGIVGPII